MTKTYDVVGMGNAVSDVIAHATDSVLDHMGIEKGIMQLVEQARAQVLYAAMGERADEQMRPQLRPARPRQAPEPGHNPKARKHQRKAQSARRERLGVRRDEL